MRRGGGGGMITSSTTGFQLLTTCIILLFLSIILLPDVWEGTKLPHTPHASAATATGEGKSKEEKEKEEEKKKIKGLYTAEGSAVVERGPDYVAKSVEDGVTLLVVYYAMWCPHCKTYAPTFQKYAKSYSKDFAVQFAAVDCARFEVACDKMKVNSYPTVKGFNFPRDGKSTINGLGASVDSYKIKAYLEKSAYRLQSSDGGGGGGEAAAEKENKEKDVEGIKQHLTQWVKETSQAKARAASPSERLNDALASLEYLLVSEAPRLVVGNTPDSNKRLLALKGLLQLVVSLMPPSFLSGEGGHPFLDLDGAVRWLERTGSETTDEGAWRKGLFEALAGTSSKKKASKTSLRGKTSSSSSSSSSSKSAYSYVFQWKVCGVPLSSTATTQADKGYTCGLWLLMHFLTVAGAKVPTSAAGATASSDRVQSTIRSLVSELFTCSSCRKHFLTVFDDCSYNRCGGGENDSLGYPRLQLWLFRLHNAVTTRIYKEKGGAPEEDLRQIVWPSTDVKLGVDSDNKIVDPQLVLQHLRQTYWDEGGWGNLHALPDHKVLASLLEG